MESLHTALSRAGNPPTGHWWTALEPTDSAHQVRVLLAWPVGAPVPAEFTLEGADVRTGTLPSRTEAFVQAELGAIEQDLLDDTPGGRLLHPAYLTFVEYLESHGHQPRHIRQTTILDDGGTPAALELAATMTHSG